MSISFLIPTFNRSTLVTRAVASILDQQPGFSEPFEVIVIDDGSVDGTTDKLLPIADGKRVHLISFDTNRGLASARNAGFRAARHEWCALLDSDNFLLPGVAAHLEKTLGAVPRDISVAWFDSIDSSGRSLVNHHCRGRVHGMKLFAGSLPGEHFPVIKTIVARANPYPNICRRHACEPSFWAALASMSDFWIDRQPVQFYETKGDDRFCSLSWQMQSAGDLAICFRHTADLLATRASKYQWPLRSKAAFYTLISGKWWEGLAAAWSAFRRNPFSRQNIMILGACLFGPRIARKALQWRSRARRAI